MTIDIPTECPKCHHKFFFKTKSKRPNPTCPECSHKFYIKSSKSSQPRSEPIKDTRSIPPLSASNGHSDHLTNDMIEHYIVQGLKVNPTNSQLIRAAVDFVTKIKSGEEKVQVLDLEKFYLIGEDNPDR